MSGLNSLAAEAHAIAVEKGWYERPRDVPELIALCHSELSEALECWRHLQDEIDLETPKTFDSEPKPVGFPIELADAIIRIVDMAAHLGVDLDAAVKVKMAYNRTRPHRHGGLRG